MQALSIIGIVWNTFVPSKIIVTIGIIVKGFLFFFPFSAIFSIYMAVKMKNSLQNFSKFLGAVYKYNILG